MALAIEVNLIDQHGRWTGSDVRENVRRFGAEDVDHVLRWALRGWNPFEKGQIEMKFDPDEFMRKVFEDVERVSV